MLEKTTKPNSELAKAVKNPPVAPIITLHTIVHNSNGYNKNEK